MSSSPRGARAGRALALLVLVLVAGGCASARQASWPTPEAAISALAETLAHDDRQRAEELFGSEALSLLGSGDEVADRQDRQRVLAAIEEAVAFEPGEAGARVAVLGQQRWPFPIPLVPAGKGWRFDVLAGLEELENRRIGRNELSTLATLHTYVDAQREYRAGPQAGDPPAWAARVFSSEGQRDGLYWPALEGEPPSPLGPLVAAAALEGYAQTDGEHAPYHGYLYRSLDAQGPHAPGGARSYRDADGRLTRGFALLAWPARYGASGVMTFLVNQQGIVFEQDLGPDTETLASAISSFDPDPGWHPTPD